MVVGEKFGYIIVVVDVVCVVVFIVVYIEKKWWWVGVEIVDDVCFIGVCFVVVVLVGDDNFVL